MNDTVNAILILVLLGFLIHFLYRGAANRKFIGRVTQLPVGKGRPPLPASILPAVKPTRVERIACPSCGHEQDAIVEAHWPWPIMVHDCEACEYIIMESEWNRVQP